MHFYCLIYSVCGTLLWPPSQTNILPHWKMSNQIDFRGQLRRQGHQEHSPALPPIVGYRNPTDPSRSRPNHYHDKDLPILLVRSNCFPFCAHKRERQVFFSSSSFPHTIHSANEATLSHLGITLIS